MPGPYEQLADPNALADAGQAAQSPEFWRALMQLQAQQSPDTLIPPPRNPAAPADWAANAVRGAAGKIANIVTLPGRAMQQGITTEEAVPWATDTALNLAGGGAPMAERGAAGAFGGRIPVFEGPVRPQDFEAARMGRAAEMGLPTDAYHGTLTEFPEFRHSQDKNELVDRALGTHFAKDPGVSNSFVMNHPDYFKDEALTGGRVIPARIPAEDKFLQVPQPLYEWAKPDTPLHQAVQTDQRAVEILAAKTAYQRDPAMLGRYISESRMVPLEEANQIARDMVAGKTATFHGSKPYTLDSFLSNYGGQPYNEADRKLLVDTARKAFQEQGYEGLRYINTAPKEMAHGAKDPTSYIVFDPARSRSRFAQFDPAKRDSRDLMAGIAGAGVVGGLATSKQDNR